MSRILLYFTANFKFIYFLNTIFFCAKTQKSTLRINKKLGCQTYCAIGCDLVRTDDPIAPYQPYRVLLQIRWIRVISQKLDGTGEVITWVIMEHKNVSGLLWLCTILVRYLVHKWVWNAIWGARVDERSQECDVIFDCTHFYIVTSELFIRQGTSSHNSLNYMSFLRSQTSSYTA